MLALEQMYATSPDFIQLRSRRPERAIRVLTRRLIVGTSVLAVLFGFGFTHVVQGTAAGPYETLTVAPGDTLWQLAERRYPNADVRVKVEEIERANRLTDPVVHPGEVLKVPSS
jgi:LysM domain